MTARRPFGLLWLAILLAGLASPALAGDSVAQATKAAMVDPVSPGPSPPQSEGSAELATLQNRGEVDRLLATAGAEALFENISTDRLGVARHRASGLTCTFAPGDRLNLVVVYPVYAGGPSAGEDVSCRTGVGEGAFVTVYASRYRPPLSEQELLDLALSDLEGVWEDVRFMDDGYLIQPAENHAAALTTGFTGLLQGHRLQSYIMVQNIGGWAFKGRASGLPDDPDVSLIGSRVYSLALPGNWDTRESFR